MYKSCLDACTKQKFEGVKVGVDTRQSNPYLAEFDRTQCIRECGIYNMARNIQKQNCGGGD